MAIKSPFLSPTDVKKQSAGALSDLASKVNEGLKGGNRLFTVPIGIVDDLVMALAEDWPGTHVRTRNPVDGTASLYVSEDVNDAGMDPPRLTGLATGVVPPPPGAAS